MLSISRASTAEDFNVGGELSRALGAWDAETSSAHGVPAELITAFFHNEDNDALVTRYSRADTSFLLARWHGRPAGCIALEPFDELAFEIRKFYVDPASRGRGIGKALLLAILAEAGKGSRSALLLQTAVYMPSAVSLYEAHGFMRCRSFRDIPDVMRRTEIFMRRPI